MNGELLGGAGDLDKRRLQRQRRPHIPRCRRHALVGPSHSRLAHHPPQPDLQQQPDSRFNGARLELRAGDRSMLDALRARAVLAQSSRYSKTALSNGVIAVIAIMLLGLFFYDRSRRELLLLSISCLSVATLRVNEFCAASLLDYSFTLCLTFVLLGNVCLTFTQVPFFYALARRRMPRFYRILLVITALPYLPTVADILLASRQPAWLGTLNTLYGRPCALITHMTLSVAPFIAFRPYKRVAGRMRPLAALCMLWGLADLVWFAVEASANTDCREFRTFLRIGSRRSSKYAPSQPQAFSPPCSDSSFASNGRSRGNARCWKAKCGLLAPCNR